LTFGQIAGFFLDSCILLPQSLKSTQEACSSFLKEEKNCFVTPSIKKEAFDLSKESYSVICTTLRYYLKPALERAGIKQITNRQGTTIATVFAEQKRRIIKEFQTRSNVRGELVGVIENYIANQVHSLKDGVSTPIDTLLACALVELEKARIEIEKPFKIVETVYVEPNIELLSLPSLRAVIKNEKDIIHIASAIKYQYQFNKWIIFLTNDEKEILNKEKELWEIFRLRCTKPCWALDYFRDITRLKSPIESFKEILIPSQQQKDFGAVIQKVLNVQIVRKPFTPK
jgi:hypothetical protein